MVSNKQKRHQGGWHGGGLWQRRQRPPLWITTTQWTSRVGWWPYGKLNIFLEFFSSLQSSDLVHPTKQQIPAQKSEGYFESEFSSPQSICKLIEKFHAHKKYVYFGRESQTLEKKMIGYTYKKICSENFHYPFPNIFAMGISDYER